MTMRRFIFRQRAGGGVKRPLSSGLDISGEIDLRGEFSRLGEMLLKEEFPVFSSATTYLETSFQTPPHTLEVGLFGPVAASDLARLDHSLAALLLAGVDVLLENDEDPFTGERLTNTATIPATTKATDEARSFRPMVSFFLGEGSGQRKGVAGGKTAGPVRGLGKRGRPATATDKASEKNEVVATFATSAAAAHEQEQKLDAAIAAAADLIETLYERALDKLEALAASLTDDRTGG